MLLNIILLINYISKENILLHYIYLTDIVTDYFSDDDFTLKKHMISFLKYTSLLNFSYAFI